MWKIIEKFRKWTEEYIAIGTATVLQEWNGEASEWQILWVDKANCNLKGTGFWKQDKPNAKAVQADFQQIALKHHEEIMKLMEKKKEYIAEIAKELEIVGEPFVPTTISQAKGTDSILHILEDNEE